MKRLERKYGICDGLKIPPDDNEAKYLRAPRPQAKKLESFLYNLSQDDIELVAAVMYGGRDYLINNRTIPLQEMIKEFAKMCLPI